MADPWPRSWSPTDLARDSPPPIHGVRFTTLIEVIYDYDQDSSFTRFENDCPNNDNNHARPISHTTRTDNSRTGYHPPRAIPMFPTRHVPPETPPPPSLPTSPPPAQIPLPTRTLTIPPPPTAQIDTVSPTTAHATIAPTTAETTATNSHSNRTRADEESARPQPTPHTIAAHTPSLPLPPVPLPAWNPTTPPRRPAQPALPPAPTTQDMGPPTETEVPTPDPNMPRPTHITVTTFNVVSARRTRLLEALRAMADLNTDIALLTETKLTRGKYARRGHGFHVFATSAVSPSQGGVALIWREGIHHWTLEGMRALSPNSISATIVTGHKRWLLLGTYLSPNTEPDTELDYLEAEYRRHPTLPVILLGDLNADIHDVGNARSISIATTLQQLGVTDTIACFPQKNGRRCTRHRHLLDGSHQRSRCDYIMTDKRVPVKFIRIIDPPRFISDHLAIKIQLISSTTQEHSRYLHNRTQLPAVQPKRDEKEPNRMFHQLMTHRTRTMPQTRPARDAWIAQDTWALIDRRNAALRRMAPSEELRPLRKAIRRKIKRDRAARLQTTGREIETHLEADDPKEAWRLVKLWYRHNERAPPPTPADLTAMGKEFSELYKQQTPYGDPIRGMVSYDVPDGVPDMAEIQEALKGLKNGRAPGASGMSVEDIKRWASEQEQTPEPWNLVVGLVQHAFRTGVVPTRARSNTLVLIPKPEPGQMRGIGLLEPVWKLISAVVNRRLSQAITFHDDLHGFLPARGTGTACLEAKLEAQLAFRSGHPIYHVYIDFSKAYDSLDRERMLTLLQDYGVGPKMMHLLRNFWARHTVIPRQQQFYGKPFLASRGLATGDIPAPTIYNIVTDAVLRRWYATIAAQGSTTRARFYADDGHLRDHNPVALQDALATMENLFLRMGLKINGRKTKALTTIPTISTTNICDAAYKRRMDGTGETYRARKARRTICTICDVAMQARSLPGHYRSQHPNTPIPPPPTLPAPTAAAAANNYIVTSPDKHQAIMCPIPECAVTMQGGWFNMRRHFHFRHHPHTITIAEEGPLPSCQECGFQCPAPHTRHMASTFCGNGRKRVTRQGLTVDILAARLQTPTFTAGAVTLDQVASFKYLGRWMTSNDSDTMAVAQNILKARMRWGQLSRLLTRRGASMRIMGLFYKATVQSVLLYGAETWTLTKPLLRMLRSFHHRCARYLARTKNVQLPDGTWTIPPSVEVRQKAGLHSIETYLQRRVDTFLPFIQSRAIYRACQTSQATQAAANHPCWWAAYPLLPQTHENDAEPLVANILAAAISHNPDPADLPDPDVDDDPLNNAAPIPVPPRRSPRTIIV